MQLRTATDGDWVGIWPIWHAIAEAGETYEWLASTSYDVARRLWMAPLPGEVLVIEDADATVRATAVIKPNRAGRGDHVANASFMVDPAARGHGLGRQLGEAVLERARSAGYQAMQFNAVVASNTGAVRLWESLGFAIVGTVPGAFRHPHLGLVGLHVMHRTL